MRSLRYLKSTAKRFQIPPWPFCVFLCVMGLLPLAATTAATASDGPLERDSVEKDYSDELPRIPPTEPRDSLEKFRIADGFQIELAAHEPILADPIAMAFDEMGRAFVVCMRGYSENGNDNLGVIRLLTDTDHDGVFDHGTDYATGLSWPTAIACYDGGVFVGTPPDLIYLRDTNHDGVADEKTRILTGFSRKNVQGMMNSFRWGLDNQLYIVAGLNGGGIERVDGQGRPVPLRGRDLAMNLVTSSAADSIRPVSGGAQHGATFDRWGERFVCSNSDHLQWIEFQDHQLRRNRLLSGFRSRRSIAVDGPSAEVYRTSKVEPWRIVRTRLRVKQMVGGPVEGGGRASGYFTSASGVTAYLGDAFSDKYRDGDFIFVGDVGSNLVHLKEVKTKGLNKSAIRATPPEKEFLTSTDNWFRPVQFANGPDGALYIIDMYRETIEHPLSLPPMIKKHLDLNSGRSRGRIYRVVPVGWQAAKRKLPGTANDSELVEMLGHENGWHRETAARLIISRHESSRSDSNQIGRKLAVASKDHSNPIARIRALYCLQSLGQLTETDLVRLLQDPHPQVRRHALIVTENAQHRGESIAERMLAMVDDDDILVRYRLALTLGAFDWQVRGEPLAKLAFLDGDNRKMRFAILSSMNSERLALLTMLLNSADPTALDKLRPLLDEITFQIGRDKREFVATLQSLSSTTEAMRDRLTGNLIVTIHQRGDKLLESLLAQGVEDPKKLLNRQHEIARTTLLSNDASQLEWRMALQILCLGRIEDIRPMLLQLLAPQQPAAIRNAVVSEIGGFDSPEAAQILIASANALPATGRRTAFSLLASRASWAKLLLDAIADETILPSHLSASNRLELLRHHDKEVASMAKSVLGAEATRESVVAQHTHVLDKNGNASRGKVAFRKVCSSCHRLDDFGTDVGPALEPLRNRGAEFMLTNILDPNREVDPRYEACNVVTTDGRVHSGIVTNDTSTSLSLLKTDGVAVSVDKQDIEVMQTTGQSLMPEGLERDLKDQGIADLIAYLIQSTTE